MNVLSACSNYGEREKKLSIVTVNQSQVTLPKNFTESLQAKSTKSLMVIKTKYGKIYYPKRWHHQLKIEQELDNHFLKIHFYALFQTQQILLFQLTIGDIAGDSIGELKDSQGVVRQVFVDMHSLNELPDLTDQQKEQCYAMQDDINELLKHLSN